LWERNWSMARVQLCLSDADFYALTPRQFHLLVDQHRERVEHQELLTGILAANIVNWSMHAPEKAKVASDFMPCRARARPERKPRLNRKKIAMDVRAFMNAQMEQRNG
jgi:hypothetical protein